MMINESDFKGKHINVIAEDNHLILSLVDHESKESNIINLGKKEV